MAEAPTRPGPSAIRVRNAAQSTRDASAARGAATLDAHSAVTLRAGALLAAGFARRFSGGAGRIITIAFGQNSCQRLGPMPGQLASAATGALGAPTVSRAAAVAHLGITVNAVNPGPTDAGWIADETWAALLSRFPTDHLGQAEDVARLVAVLASAAAARITGQVSHAEGGFHRG